MKQELRRIEAVLDQMTGQIQADLAEPLMLPAIAPIQAPPPATVSLPSFSLSESLPLKHQPQSPGLAPTLHALAIADSLAETGLPALPPITNPQFTTHRNVANPALSMNLLKELERIVGKWQAELQQVSAQIHTLYATGPIVDGWLESCAPVGGASTRMFRHVEAGSLLEAVEQAFATANKARPIAESGKQPAPTTGYRLCGLNEDGQLWFRECPPDQVIAVSLAIARYQKLQILTKRRQELEAHLGGLAESLIALHAQMQSA